MDTVHSIGSIAVTALCAAVLRAAPFMLFGGKREVPDASRSGCLCVKG